jgi:hypothetical protein
LDVKDVFDQARPSVVLIVAYDSNDQPQGIGSGFFVDDGKSIATNYHVIANAKDLKIKSSDGQVGNVLSILGINEKNDLALLEVDIQGQPLKLSMDQPDIGEDILAIGNPSGLEGTVSTGIVSGIRTEEGSQYFQITAPISPGSSGGPIIDENTQVIGVASFYLDGAQSLNFAMPSAYVQKLLNNKDPQPLTVLSKKTPQRRFKLEENVKVMFPTLKWSLGVYLNASVVNKSGQAIKNVKIVVNYFGNDKEVPIHHSLHQIKEIIHPNLSMRFGRKIEMAEVDWSAVISILDYEIVNDPNSQKLLTFD